MSGVQHIDIGPDEDGLRLDRWFKLHFPQLSHGRLQKMLRKGEVRLDGKKTAANIRVLEGQQVRVPPVGDQAEKTKKIAPQISQKDEEFIKSLVLYKSKDEIVINKPAGLAVQGGSKTVRHIDALLDGLKFDLEERPKLVHRLDRDTSGALLLARHRKAASRLTKAFKDHVVQKTYWALVNGVPRPSEGRIDMPLVKAGKQGEQRMYRAEGGEPGLVSAISDFSLIANAGMRFSWLALSPRTGRTHQLRVHCREIGNAIFGDHKYKNETEEVEEEGDMTALGDGLHLHAAEIKFPLANGHWHKVSAPLPAHMKQSWQLLGFEEKLDHDPFEGVDL